MSDRLKEFATNVWTVDKLFDFAGISSDQQTIVGDGHDEIMASCVIQCVHRYTAGLYHDLHEFYVYSLKF